MKYLIFDENDKFVAEFIDEDKAHLYVDYLREDLGIKASIKEIEPAPETDSDGKFGFGTN